MNPPIRFSHLEEVIQWCREWLAGKADRSELSNIYAEEELSPENFPEMATYSRQELKLDLFIDQWNLAWGDNGYYDTGATDGRPFVGNGLRMNFEEAMQVMATYPIISTQVFRTDKKAPFRQFKGRTVLPFYINGQGGRMDASEGFWFATNCEIIRLNPVINKNINAPYEYGVYKADGMFYNCAKIHTIKGLVFKGDTTASNIFIACYKLENLELINLNTDISLRNSNFITSQSLQDIIDERYVKGRWTADTFEENHINITVHPDVYAKLTDETNTEWHRVLLNAADKDITFITT